MIVVSDTTVITTLIKAGEAEFLRSLFSEVLVPPAVWNELLVFHPAVPAFVRLCEIAGAMEQNPKVRTLGRGEQEAIQLAREVNADFLITDDRKARLAAAEFGLTVTGLVGLVVKARMEGRIPSAKQLISKLETSGGLYLSEAVVAVALRLAGETT